jgi:hypothetical protein
MRDMKSAIACFASLGVVVSLVGCAVTQLRPGAEMVLVTHAPPPESCRFVGTVVGQQGGSLEGQFTSNKTLAEGAVNDLKNQAYEKGANYVLLETTSTGNTMSGGPRYVSGGQTDVTHMGNAFVCPQQSEPPRPDQAAR